MVKKIIIPVLLGLLITTASAQESETQFPIKKGLLKAHATFSLGSMYFYDNTVGNAYLHGGLEYYTDPKLSIRSDGYYYLGAIGDNKKYEVNHSLFTGASYHFNTNSGFDPYLGIQPGIAYSQKHVADSVVTEGNAPEIKTFNPLFSFVGGFNYYAPKIFHLFIDIRYLRGKHLSHTSPFILDELRISFGLGFNINVKK